jgi:hypothetical protein
VRVQTDANRATADPVGQTAPQRGKQKLHRRERGEQQPQLLAGEAEVFGVPGEQGQDDPEA